MPSSKHLHVCKSSISNGKVVLSITGSVERVTSTIYKSLFWMNFDALDKSGGFISFTMNSIELNAFGYALTHVSEDGYEKFSGGNATRKSIYVEKMQDNKRVRIKALHKKLRFEYILEEFQNHSLRDEITFIVEETLNRTFELQRVVAKKRRVANRVSN